MCVCAWVHLYRIYLFFTQILPATHVCARWSTYIHHTNPSSTYIHKTNPSSNTCVCAREYICTVSICFSHKSLLQHTCVCAGVHIYITRILPVHIYTKRILPATHVCVRVSTSIPYLFVHHCCMYDIFTHMRALEYIYLNRILPETHVCVRVNTCIWYLFVHDRCMYDIFTSIQSTYVRYCLHIAMSHGTYMNESWHIYDTFTRYSEYMCTILFAYCDESWHTYECVMAHT